jgi:hypothetical protein
MGGAKDFAAVSDVGHKRPRRDGEQGMRAVSAIEALQLQLLERRSSLLTGLLGGSRMTSAGRPSGTWSAPAYRAQSP